MVRELEEELKALPNVLTVSQIARYLINWFKSRKNLIKPYSLLRRQDALIEILELKGARKLKLKQIIRDFVKNLTLEEDFEVKKAPQIKWEHMFELAKTLFLTKQPKYKGSMLKRKAAAVGLVISLFSGMRWGDIVKIKWQDLRKFTRDGKQYLVIKLRATKTVWDASLNQPIFLPFLGSKHQFKYKCPVYYLKKFWIFLGKPRTNFLEKGNFRNFNK